MDEKSQRMKAWIVAMGVLFLIGAFFFLWHVWVLVNTTMVNVVVEKKKAPDMRLVAPETNKEPYSFQELFQPVIQSLEPIISSVASNLHPPYDSFELFTEDHKPSFAHAIESTRPLHSSDPAFSVLWPDFYIAYLKNMQQIMVESGMYAEQKYHFASEDEIFVFLEDFIGFLEKERVLTHDEVAQAIKGVREDLPRSQDEELRKRALREQTRNVFDSLLALLLGREAFAQLLPNVPGGDCYKDLAPLNPVPGVNLWAPCCDCEVDFGAGAVPLGCLNAVCAAWPNAIWDAFWNPAGTGICGCG